MELEHAVENWASTLMQKSFEVSHFAQIEATSSTHIFAIGSCFETKGHQISCRHLLKGLGQSSRICTQSSGAHSHVTSTRSV
jgi:hypothetical protein